MSDTNTSTQARERLQQQLPGLSISQRESPRAKRLILRLIPGRGLEIVFPHQTRQADIDRLLQSKESWITRTARRMIEQGIDLSGRPLELPQTLELNTIARTIPITYTDRPGQLRLRHNAGTLAFSGPLPAPGDASAPERTHIFKRLREEVRTQAKTILPPRLRTMSEQTGLGFDDVQIRCQRTRWGSCARRGTQTKISLNAKLLFLPPQLSDQVLLHELCHLAHHNHSPAFWALVTQLSPDARKLEQQLGHGYRWVPAWWDASF